jgi:predicted metal-dependent hydrolase
MSIETAVTIIAVCQMFIAVQGIFGVLMGLLARSMMKQSAEILKKAKDDLDEGDDWKKGGQ